MFFAKYIVIIFLVCARVSTSSGYFLDGSKETVQDLEKAVAVGDRCELLTSPSGKIVLDEETVFSKEAKCWTIRVLSNSFTTVDVERFTSNGNCHIYKLTIISRNEEDTIYCPNNNNWKRFTAVDNFTMILKRGTPKATQHLRIGLTINYQSVTGVFTAEGVPVSRAESVQWMEDNWSLTSGWQEKTPRAIIALNLATGRNFKESKLINGLVVKQLEVQALAALLRNASNEVSINQLSMFVNALLVTCQNPRNFHGFDLVTLLKEKALVSPLASLPMAYLALCNAKASLSDDSATRKLNSILTSETDYPFMLEIQAVSVMALSCMEDQQTKRGNKSGEFFTAISKMKQLQRKDGSFGNIYTTATITQALLSSGEELSPDWSVKSAVTHLMQHLNSTDADVSSTALILPILNGKSMTDIRETNCTGDFRWIAESASIKDRLGSKMRVKYSLYVGDEKDVVHTISLRVPENVTAFDVMNVAKEEDVKYDFKWKEMKSSKYVYEIAGKANDFEENQFWFLYFGKGENDIVHLKKSPDHSVLQNEDHMIMWYKKAEISPGLTK